MQRSIKDILEVVHTISGACTAAQKYWHLQISVFTFYTAVCAPMVLILHFTDVHTHSTPDYHAIPTKHAKLRNARIQIHVISKVISLLSDCVKKAWALCTGAVPLSLAPLAPPLFLKQSDKSEMTLLITCIYTPPCSHMIANCSLKVNICLTRVSLLQ